MGFGMEARNLPEIAKDGNHYENIYGVAVKEWNETVFQVKEYTLCVALKYRDKGEFRQCWLLHRKSQLARKG